MRYRRTALIALLILVPLGALSGVSPVRSEPQEVDPAQDNPPGCKTATGEDQEGCGAQGRNHTDGASHVPPIKACADVRSAAGSVVTRRLPMGPRRADGKFAFVTGVCVYLPPGYETSGMRYPAVYLLHGGGGDQANWIVQAKLQQMLDEAYAADPERAVIAVTPDGRSGQWFDYYDRSFLLESYMLDHVIPYIDAKFRTIADRRGRAIAGLSNGGYGALHFAAKAPDLFVAAGSMSGNVGARGMGGLGTPVAPGVQAQEAGAYYYGNVPISLVPNLDPVDLIIDWGATCTSDVAVDACATFAFEQSFRGDNQAFNARLKTDGYTGKVDYREAEGSHAWRWWTKWLRERDMPFFWPRLADPEPASAPQVRSPLPATFRYKSIAPGFDIFGYEVTMQRPAREFFELRNVSKGGLQAVGSGIANIATAPRYVPGGRYRISGSGPETEVTADGLGRLRFAVDLGAPHQYEQFTAPQRAQEATSGGQYMRQRTVTITALGKVDAARPRRSDGTLPATGGSQPWWPALVAMSVALLGARALWVRSGSDR